MDKICTHCDKQRKVHSRGMCRSCYDKELKLKDPEYRERQNLNARIWRATHKEHLSAKNKIRWADPQFREKERIKKWNLLLKSYGLTQEDYDIKLANGCELCGAKNAGAYHLDHCHETGKFRGLLCSKCNNGLGMLGDNIEGLQRALLYIQKTTH